MSDPRPRGDDELGARLAAALERRAAGVAPGPRPPVDQLRDRADAPRAARRRPVAVAVAAVAVAAVVAVLVLLPRRDSPLPVQTGPTSVGTAGSTGPARPASVVPRYRVDLPDGYVTEALGEDRLPGPAAGDGRWVLLLHPVGDASGATGPWVRLELWPGDPGTVPPTFRNEGAQMSTGTRAQGWTADRAGNTQVAWWPCADACAPLSFGSSWLSDEAIPAAGWLDAQGVPLDDALRVVTGLRRTPDGKAWTATWVPPGLEVGYLGPAPTSRSVGRLRVQDAGGTEVTVDVLEATGTTGEALRLAMALQLGRTVGSGGRPHVRDVDGHPALVADLPTGGWQAVWSVGDRYVVQAYGLSPRYRQDQLLGFLSRADDTRWQALLAEGRAFEARTVPPVAPVAPGTAPAPIGSVPPESARGT